MGAITITLEGLTTGRGGEALGAPLDLRLASGEALIVTGPNGAGKSTLIRTLAGLLPPLRGQVRLGGALAPDGEPARQVGEIAHYLGHRNGLRAGARLFDELAFWHRFLGGESREATGAVEAGLEAVGLPGLSGLSVGHLSSGQQRRAAIARLLLVPRPLWLLDEPTAALDAKSQARFARLAQAHLEGGGLIVAATHQPLGVEGLRVELAAPPQEDRP
ncbi:heme ABC exporter ATP-binding protein CcmA [Aureimonas populi]|uniref:Heme ABC exporter ATP-binding protein CcmA n=1 Tax=Aureimonas populi TaxID=1701758 RepID=A0ABW5CPH2_9HYPH|nr:heme ABC exporter ATP-binding protein CcmA [Aureimonas populi]